ncbi:hypothetical protein CO611_07055 [Lysobacteraceae bacterium NML03-0222]|nr:hypothetical protein CO611_07055 [Xanthomonadaceae bacterium NML03-0222]
MNRLKKLSLTLGFWLLTGLLAGLWIVLPWQALLVLPLLVGLWLGISRSGQLALAVLRMGLAGLPQRWGAALVIVIGIAGVTGVLTAMLAMGMGFASTLKRTGSDSTVILLRGGSQTEINSVITREQAQLASLLPGIARNAQGRPMVSPEITQVIALPSRDGSGDANVQLRGISAAGWEIRPHLRIIAGRSFTPGKQELVVGQGAARQFAHSAIGDTLRIAGQSWTVVGHFASDDAHDSELWADADAMGELNRYGIWQAVMLRLVHSEMLAPLRQALAADPRLKLDAETTLHHYGKQSEQLKTLLDVLGRIIGAIMAVGAAFGALNSMYAVVAGRRQEIGTLRAMGFAPFPVVAAVMLETLLLALVGGLLGGFIAWSLFNGYSVNTLGRNFSQVVFQFQVTPGLLLTGLHWAIGIGLIGGLLPALRAARMPITEALRAG